MVQVRDQTPQGNRIMYLALVTGVLSFAIAPKNESAVQFPASLPASYGWPNSGKLGLMIHKMPVVCSSDARSTHDRHTRVDQAYLEHTPSFITNLTNLSCSSIYSTYVKAFHSISILRFTLHELRAVTCHLRKVLILVAPIRRSCLDHHEVATESSRVSISSTS